MVLCLLPRSTFKQHCCSFEPVHRSIKKSTYNVHKPVGLVAESPSLLLSASVDSEEHGEAVSPFASNERDTSE